MKYLYKGMEQPSLYNTAVLLNWHEKVFGLEGALTDYSWWKLRDSAVLLGIFRIDAQYDGYSVDL